ncbi:MAG: hypothetical protein ACO1OO_00065 [Flavisolibacter sp.]
MLKFIDLPTWLLFAGTLTLLGYHYFSRKQNVPELKRVFTHFIIATATFFIMVLLLSDRLPSTPVLKSFGYPETVAEIRSDEKLLYFLQEYNKAPVATAVVTERFFFYFLWWFLPATFLLLRVMKVKLSADQNIGIE